MSNDFNTAVASLCQGMDTFLSTKTVVGEPIKVGDITIIPMCDVNIGIGAGAYAGNKGTNNAGGGMGGKLSPSSIIVIKDGYAQIINANSEPSALEKIIDMLPGAVDKVKATIENKKVTKAEEEEIRKVTDEVVDTNL